VGLSPSPLQINIDGEAGTGKLYFIAVLFTILCDMARANGKPLPLVQAGPTGIAAFNINSRTMYELLRLPVNHPFKELPAASFTPLQQAFKDIYYLIFNKKSMIGQVHLAWINCCFCQIYFVCNNDYFKGLNILLIGNFYQFPPVG